MKVFVPCRHPLGDVLSAYFCPVNYGMPNPKAHLFARLRNACRAGACTSAFVVSDFSFWSALDFRIEMRPAGTFEQPMAENGWILDQLDGHANLLRQPPKELLRFPSDPAVELPVRTPVAPVPERYILFSDGAGKEDRWLLDPAIVGWLRSYLPVVRIGSSGRHWRLPMGARGATSADLDLCDAAELVEVFWLARHARLIVSPCTYLRTMSAIFGTPVLELAQADSVEASTVTRTVREYAGLEYGMRPGTKNAWCFWNGRPSPEANEQVQRLLATAAAPQ